MNACELPSLDTADKLAVGCLPTKCGIVQLVGGPDELIYKGSSQPERLRALERVVRAPQHIGQRPLVSSTTRELDGFFCERPAVCDVGVPGQLLRLQCEQAGASSGIRGIVELDRALNGGNPLVIDCANCAGEASVVGQ